ncbi:MAG: hypothetical protein JSS82_14085 [Bacteroidetes bacterium]|nr:hypothetical protein [Bacteroidota bacterium]
MQQQVLATAKEQKNRNLEVAATAELGYFFYACGSTVQGTRMILDALKMAETTNDPRIIGIAYQNLAVTSIDDEAKSRELYEKALSYSTSAGDNFFICTELLGLAQFFYTRHVNPDLDSSLYYAENSYRLALSKNNEVLQLFSLIALASIHQQLGNNGLALEYIHTAERLPIRQHNRLFSSLIYNSYTKFYQITGQRDSAFVYARKSLENVQGAFLSQEIKPVTALRQLYTGVNSDSALKYANRYLFLLWWILRQQSSLS